MRLWKVVASGSVFGFHEKLMRLLLGSKNGITDIPAVNVLSFIDAMDKRIPKFRKMYDALSEYAHPNWSGMMLLYSKHDEKRFWTEFGRNPRDNTNVEISGLTTLMGSLGAFELVYNKVGDLVPAIVKLCEADIKISTA